MVWDTIELRGYVFYFKVETLPALERIRVRETIYHLIREDDPLAKVGVIECPNHERFVIQIEQINHLFLAFKVHDESDPDFPNSIELVDIIDLRLI